MPRPIRKKLKFDEDSVNKLLQEIYDDSHNQKAKITRLFTKWETKVKEGGEIQAIGDQIVKVIALEAKNVDQKIMLLKFLKEVVFDNKSGGSGSNEQSKSNEVGENISADRRNELLNFVQEELERKEKERK
jgi:hypothetical protein